MHAMHEILLGSSTIVTSRSKRTQEVQVVSHQPELSLNLGFPKATFPGRSYMGMTCIDAP